MQTPGAQMRRGNEEVCVFEIVRPGMEDSESAEKQENTGIGPTSACRGKSAFTRVFHALWHAPRVPSAPPECFSALRPPLDSGSVKQGCSPRAQKRSAGKEGYCARG